MVVKTRSFGYDSKHVRSILELIVAETVLDVVWL